MKICVYAICKNESKFLDRWLHSIIDEADYISILDTGSTDSTYDDLCNYSDNSWYSEDWNHKAKIIVDKYDFAKELGMMRFDKARNRSLSLVPPDSDICVVLDLDQVPVKGWSDIIKERFKQGYTEVHGDIIDHDINGKELNRWQSNNVHPNSPYWIWERIIHEGLHYYGKDQNNVIYDNNFIINHYPDFYKDRSLYKELLYYSCKEYPKDPYYGIYLGIELSRRGTREEAAEAFRRCIRECDFDDSQQSLSLKYQTYLNLAITTDNLDEAISSVENAIAMRIKTRRAYKILADIYEKKSDYDETISYLLKALEVKSYSSDWTDDIHYFDGYIEDRLSLLYYYQKHNYLKAMEYCSKALQIDPNNSRINKNLDFYYDAYIKSRSVL